MVAIEYLTGTAALPSNRGAGKGTRGHVPLRNCHAENFITEQYGIFAFNQIFSTIFGFLRALPQTPPGLCHCMDPAGYGTHSFVPFRNKSLATPLSSKCYCEMDIQLKIVCLTFKQIQISTQLWWCFVKLRDQRAVLSLTLYCFY